MSKWGLGRGGPPRVPWSIFTPTTTWCRGACRRTPIRAEEEAGLRAQAARSPRAARAALAQAVELREAIFELFSSVAAGADGASWAWSDEPRLDRVLWPVLRAAARLLTSLERERVRQCAAGDCAWLFLDRSRNGTRRWCDMTVCGNREKARRFQRRARRSP